MSREDSVSQARKNCTSRVDLGESPTENCIGVVARDVVGGGNQPSN